MAIETYQFMNEGGVQKLAELLLTKVNLRISERIVTEVTEGSTDKQVASAKAVYALIKALQDADLATSNRVDTQGETIGSHADEITSINEDQLTQDDKITDIETGISELSEVVAGLTHLTINVVTGDINTLVTEPNTDVLYLQRDSEEDRTWMIYMYSETIGWINVGDTEVDLSNYWTKDDIEEMQVALNMHNVESIPDDYISSSVNEIFKVNYILIEFIITSANRHMFGYTNDTADMSIPKTFTYAGINYRIAEIGDYAFYECNNLNNITIPACITRIGDYAFSGCTKLYTIIIPSSVTSIGMSAFRNCTNLTKIIISEGVNISGLTSIVISNSVTNISDNAFIGCSNIATVYYTGTEDQWNSINVGTNNTPLINATKIYNYTSDI